MPENHDEIKNVDGWIHISTAVATVISKIEVRS
jgi:hypothetical protein